MDNCKECGARSVKGQILHRPNCASGIAEVTFEHLHLVHHTNVGGWQRGLIDDDGLKAVHAKLHANDPVDHTPAIQAAVNAISKTGWIEGYGPQALGSMGGKARAAKLTPEQRSGAARKAAKARWAK